MKEETQNYGTIQQGNRTHCDKMGIFHFRNSPILGASPDEITHNECLIEIKKVISEDGETMTDTLCGLAVCKQSKDGIALNTKFK